MSALPIDAVAPAVIAALGESDVVLQAEPGAGKSTGLPLALLAAPPVAGKVLLLEPRRLAAQRVAERLAAQLGEPLGERVGLRMRATTRVSPRSRIEVLTEGVLTRLLQADPALAGVGLVIFDEFHERSLQADLGLALCREVKQGLRPELRLLLMSATLAATPLAAELGAVAIDCPLRRYPVAMHWLGESRAPLAPRIVAAVQRALADGGGDVLVFLPGRAEIARCERQLRRVLDRAVQLCPLHGGLDGAAQRRATAPARPGERRVILASAIAETSLTIDGVAAVVDAGLERRAHCDRHGLQRLETVAASRASAEQRAGRAGRTGPGRCYRLWNESGHGRRAARWQPAIERAPLSGLLFELGQWGAVDAALPWLSPPPPAALARARAQLIALGLWGERGPNALGRAAAALPLPPHLAAMVLWAAARGAGERACRWAALLEGDRRGGDGVDLHGAVDQLHPSTERRARQLAARLGALALPPGVDSPGVDSPGVDSPGVDSPGVDSPGVDSPGVDMPTTEPPADAVLLARAFPAQLAQRRDGAAARYRLAGGGEAWLADTDPLAQSPWLVVAELGGGGESAQVFAALALSLDALQCSWPSVIEARAVVRWDDRAGRVSARRERRLGQLLLSSQPEERVACAPRRAALCEGIRLRGLDCLPWSAQTRQWQARVGRLRALDGETWPALDDAALLDDLDWLQPWLDGLSSLRDLLGVDLAAALAARLDNRQQRALARLMPSHWTVPSGSRVAIDYCAEGAPVLAVKLQEMFGCQCSPAVADGRQPLLLHLLSPARRPVQVTADLASFWANGYSAVRRELAGRYPKHPWPQDPLTAAPSARAKPRRR